MNTKNLPTLTVSERQLLKPSDVLDSLKTLWLTKRNKHKDEKMAEILGTYLKTLSDLPPWALVDACKSLQQTAEWFPSDREIRAEASYFAPRERPEELRAIPHQPSESERQGVLGGFTDVLQKIRPRHTTMEERERPPPRYLKFSMEDRNAAFLRLASQEKDREAQAAFDRMIEGGEI